MAWLQTIRNPLYAAQLAPRSAGVRGEKLPKPEASLHSRVEGLSALQPQIKNLPLYPLLCRAWLLVPSCLLPSPTQAGPTYILESLTHSVNKHVICSHLVPGPWQSHGLERQVGPLLLLWKPEAQVSWPHLYMFWGYSLQGKPFLKVSGTPGWNKEKFEGETMAKKKKELDDLGVRTMSLGRKKLQNIP